MKRIWLGFFIFLCYYTKGVHAQPFGGNAVYNFVTLPHAAKATALGGVNISYLGDDLGLAMFNPALMEKNMDGDIHLSVKPFYAGIQQYDFSGVHYFPNSKLITGLGVHYLDYGNIKMTDAAGNTLGDFHPNDYSVQFSAAMNYKRNFFIGSSLKFIQSNYGMYKSNGLALDVGVRYLANSGLSQVSVLVNNLGFQLKKYLYEENLPFNMIIGWSKQLENAPFQFSITAERLSVWNNTYNDIHFNAQEGFQSPASLQNVFNHVVLGAEVYLGSQFNLNVGYNFIRRFDLNIQGQQNWFNGISTGAGLKYNRLQYHYANSFFQRNMYHHISVYYSLKRK